MTGSGAPLFFASSRLIRRSLRIQSTAKPKSNLSSTMVLQRLSICQDWAAPLPITSSTCFMSSPALRPKLMPSARPCARPAMQIWLTILVSWPEPACPSRVTALAKWAMTGLAASNAAASPPHITVSVPFSAPACPPETGASMKWMPFFAAAAKKGIHFIDAPVSGGQAGAENGTLTVMCGGEAAAFEAAKPVVAHFAKAVTLLGPSGSGQLTKMVNQTCIAGLVQGLAEGINFGLKAGLDMKQVLDVIGKGAAQSWQMDNRGKTMVDDKFDFGFAVDWML